MAMATEVLSNIWPYKRYEKQLCSDTGAASGIGVFVH